MEVVSKTCFSNFLDRFRQGSTGIVRFGHELTTAAAVCGIEELFHNNGMTYRILSRGEIRTGIMREEGPDQLLFVGDMSLRHDDHMLHRARWVLTGIGVPVFMSHPRFVDRSLVPVDFDTIFVDDTGLSARHPAYEACPDISLAMAGVPAKQQPDFQYGVFLRQPPSPLNLGDPADFCHTVGECRELFAHFSKIISDCPKIAAIAVAAGRQGILLTRVEHRIEQNLYEGVFEFLDDSDGVNGLAEELETASRHLYQRLCGRPSECLSFDALPERRHGFVLREGASGKTLVDPRGGSFAACDDVSALVWQLCSGDLSIAEMVEALSDEYGEPRRRIARDTQNVLREFVARGVVQLVPARRVSGKEEASSVKLKQPTVRVPLAAPGQPAQALQLFVRQPEHSGSSVSYSARLWGLGVVDEELWFRSDASVGHAVTERADPFVLASLYYAMRRGATLWVRGAPVSSSLIDRLDEFQQAWCAWSDRLHHCEIIAEEIQDSSVRDGEPAILTFSGGADSCYSVFRHVVEPDRFRNRHLTAALMVHGFDVPWTRDYEPVLRRGRRILDTTPLRTIVLKTNIKRICGDWNTSHALGLAAALTFFSRGFGSGLIASTMPYNLLLSNGSNPVTDWMMGSRYFEISSDATAVTRLEKIRAIARWPAAREHLRFCWKDEALGNCGRCAKCLLTAILFRVLGHDPSLCFREALTDELIAQRLTQVRFGQLEMFDARAALREAQSAGDDFYWQKVLEDLC